MPKVIYKNLNNITRSNFTPVNDFIESRDFRNQRLWRIKDGRLFAIVDGEMLEANEFNERYPLNNPVTFLFAPENADSTKNFLH